MNVYIHIPFCKHKCSYCHFYSIASDQINTYATCLIKDIKNNLVTQPIETIYIGGGTPTLLTTAELTNIINTIKEKSTTTIQEITLEAHPYSLINHDPEKLITSSITRLSIGIQSWQSPILTHMNRQFDKDKLISYIKTLKQLHFDNINLDHIIAYPSQTDELLKKDIDQTISLDPKHISIYPLEIHPHTQLENLSQNESVIVNQFSLVQNALTKGGYRHYEELNFAKAGYECRHNLHFWQGKDYLGFGPGAVGRQGNSIVENKPSVSEYIAAIKANTDPPHIITILTPSQKRKLTLDLQQRILL